MKENSYIKEFDKHYRGFRYIGLALGMGHRCGYVKIPKNHELYMKGYDEPINIKLTTLENESIGKRSLIPILCFDRQKNLPMDVLFDVHGGITFANKLRKFNGWWIGFDCAHAGDKKDVNIMDSQHKEIYKKLNFNMPNDVIRTKEYVEQECKNLIDQIIKYFGDNNEKS